MRVCGLCSRASILESTSWAMSAIGATRPIPLFARPAQGDRHRSRGEVAARVAKFRMQSVRRYAPQDFAGSSVCRRWTRNFTVGH